MSQAGATPQPNVKPIPREANPVFNGSAPPTEVNRVEYSSSGTVRVIEVPSQSKDTGFNWTTAFDEIRAGIWAVALTGAFLWVVTSNLRNKIGGGIASYYKKQIEILDSMKVNTSNNSSILIGMENRANMYSDKVKLIEENTTETLEILREMREDRYKES